MSDQEYRIKVFNQIFFEFIGDLIRLYPEDRTLSLAQTGISALVYITPIELPKQFYTSIGPFEKEILAKNEAFFLHESFTKTFADDAYISNEIKRIMSIWKDPNTSNETKKLIWSYLIKLTRLSRTIQF
jgi:hypothetical protein